MRDIEIIAEPIDKYKRTRKTKRKKRENLKFKVRSGSGRKRRELRENRGKGWEFMNVGVFLFLKNIIHVSCFNVFFNIKKFKV